MLVSSGATGAVNIREKKKTEVVILGALALYMCPPGILSLNSLLFHVFILYVVCYFPRFLPHALPRLLCGACVDKDCRREENCETELFLKYASPQFPFSLSLRLRQIFLFRCIVKGRKREREVSWLLWQPGE